MWWKGQRIEKQRNKNCTVHRFETMMKVNKIFNEGQS